MIPVGGRFCLIENTAHESVKPRASAAPVGGSDIHSIRRHFARRALFQIGQQRNSVRLPLLLFRRHIALN
jgi:hypothetical protein